MRVTSLSTVSRTTLGVGCAAMLIVASTGLNGRAAPATTSLPVLVGLAKKSPVFVDAKADGSGLRISSPDGRLPPPNGFSTAFAAGDLNQGGYLLSESAGRVLSYSPLNGELSIFDVASGKSSLLLPAGTLPTGLRDLEVSSRGIAVLAGAGDVTRLVVVRLPPSPGARADWTEVRLPIDATDTAFSSAGLLVLSNKDRALYEISASDLPFLGAPREAPGEIKYTKLLKELQGSPAAVAEWREVFYVSLGRDLLVIPREMRQSSTIVPIPSPLDQVDRLRVSEEYLLAADVTRGRIAVAHRPVPVTISFQGDAANTITKLLRVFDVLAGYRLLPTRMIRVDRDSTYELMVTHEILPPLRGGSLSAGAQEALDGILCRLNPSMCSPLRLARGAQLRVPDVPLNQRPLTTSVDLETRTIADVLDARLFPEHRPSGRDLLRRVLNANRLLDRTLDAQLFRLNFIPWELGASKPLQPGTPLALREDGTFEVVSSDPPCSPKVDRTPLPKRGTGLDAVLRTGRVDHLKPLLNIDGTIDVGVDEVGIVASSPDALKACRPPATVATHVALDVLVTNRVFVRASDANAAVQYPDPASIQNAKATQPSISETERPEWSVTLEGPVVLGFRVLPVASGAQVEAQVAFKRLLDIRGGRFNLLVTGWEPLVVVPAKDLAGVSALKDIESVRDPRVQISPLERSRSRATASSVDASAGEDKVLKAEERRAEGDRIRGLIKYPAAPVDASSVIIAIVENSKSVDLHHPDFKRQQDGLSIWSKPTADGREVELDNFPTSTTDLPAVERQFSKSADHGTHVAGIVAGLGQPFGLAPQAGLFLVPMESQADQINALLQLAADIPAPIANFSQTFPIDPQIQKEIGGGLDLLADRLLVVAAVDNDHTPLTGTLLRAPIGWSDGPNVIGVAAADEQRQILASSDRGKRYVQLLAIGKDVLSLANKGGYARTSGASQAAPQVASAAALLVALAGQRLPVQIKARLIATADWDDSYEDKVWAGFLNVDRAVSNLLSDVLDRTGQPTRLSVAFHPNMKLKLKKSIEYAPDAPTPTNTRSGGDIEWSKVLRVTRQTWLPTSRGERDAYRIVYVGSENKVSILKNVEFHPNQSFPLKRCVRLDGTTPPADECRPLLSDQIEDYIAKFPGMRLRFVRQVGP